MRGDEVVHRVVAHRFAPGKAVSGTSQSTASACRSALQRATSSRVAAIGTGPASSVPASTACRERLGREAPGGVRGGDRVGQRPPGRRRRARAGDGDVETHQGGERSLGRPALVTGALGGDDLEGVDERLGARDDRGPGAAGRATSRRRDPTAPRAARRWDQAAASSSRVLAVGGGQGGPVAGSERVEHGGECRRRAHGPLAVRRRWPRSPSVRASPSTRVSTAPAPSRRAASMTVVGTPAFVSRPRSTRSWSRLTVRSRWTRALSFAAREHRGLGLDDAVEVGHGPQEQGLVGGRAAGRHRRRRWRERRGAGHGRRARRGQRRPARARRDGAADGPDRPSPVTRAHGCRRPCRDLRTQAAVGDRPAGADRVVGTRLLVPPRGVGSGHSRRAGGVD